MQWNYRDERIKFGSLEYEIWFVNETTRRWVRFGLASVQDALKCSCFGDLTCTVRRNVKLLGNEFN
jgi:hypothetical protein